MKIKNYLSNAFMAVIMLAGFSVFAQMDSSKSITENVANASELSTLNGYIAETDAATLLSEGEYTLFAPSNEGFNSLNERLKPAVNKKNIEAIVKYHVLEGNYTIEKLKSMIEDNHGRVMLTTVSGKQLTVSTSPMDDSKIIVVDNVGSYSTISTSNKQSNGTVHVLDGVLMPFYK